jgi:hypothetical protein
MFHVLVLVAACAGESTAPEAPATPNTPVVPTAPVGFRVLPGTVTVEIHQHIRFRGELRTIRGQVSAPKLSWEASGGEIDTLGNFVARVPGTYRVVGRGHGRDRDRALSYRPDTSVVVVIPRQPGVVGVRVTPRAPRLVLGEQRSFAAVGRLRNGTTAPIGVRWKATGGSIDAAGVFQAGSTPGTYHVIATNVGSTLADTVRVRIHVPTMPDTLGAPPPDSTPGPTPDPNPEPTLGRVVLQPGSVVLATRATHQFAAFGRNTTGDSVAVEVRFQATGGTITPTGLYTAGPSAGTFRVIATSSELADTAVVTLARVSAGDSPPAPAPGTGIPMGASGVLTAGGNPSPYTMSLDGYNAEIILGRLAEARAKNLRVLMILTGGAHDQYKTNGVFDMAKWQAKMNTYNTPAIRAAVAGAVADGTIIGNSVMDEPHNRSPGADWGGTLTKARVDDMCRYVKGIFPTLPVGVVHQHDKVEPEKNYAVCDFIMAQYRTHRGTPIDVHEFREGALAFGRRSGVAIIFSMNILAGGTPSATCEKFWQGNPNNPNLCPMTGAQIQEYGLVLGPAGCALNMWRYDRRLVTKPDVQEALRSLASSLATLPRKPCTRS